MKKTTTDFGFKEVPITEKSKLVESVFHSVAGKYDLMNDIMSFGLHRLWKKFTIEQSGVRRGQYVLDLAGGTGDLAKVFAKRVGPQGLTILSDINSSMLAEGRKRLLDEGIVQNIQFVEADAEKLPFKENYFDCITIAFGLRNVTDKMAALRSMYHVLKPGGKLLVLEFSKPILPFMNKIYDQYSFHIIPEIGKWVTGDKESYAYLVESIRKHPDQETLKSHMLACQFEDVSYHNLTGGIVALHKGFKY